MLTNEAYKAFEAALLPIAEDTLCHDPDESLLEQGFYFVRKGLMALTENHIYVYDPRRIPAHKEALLKICRSLPKRQGATEQLGGVISCEDLFADFRKYPDMTKQDGYYMLLFANNFANLLEASGIAKPQAKSANGHSAFFLLIHPKYGAYINGESDLIPE